MLSTALLMAASMVVGQAGKAAAPDAHLEAYKSLVGDWVGEFVVPAGFTEIAPEGSKVVRRVKTRWVLNKSFIRSEVINEVDGKPTSTATEIMGWDPNSKKVAHWIFGSGGIVGGGEWNKEGDTMVLKWWYTTEGMTKYQGTSRLRKQEPDIGTWQVVDSTKNGEKVPDLPVIEFRQQPKADKAKSGTGTR